MRPNTAWLFPLYSLFCLVEGHGRMLLPPSRPSAFRLDIPGAPVNYNDNQQYCGGKDVQHNLNGGKCGICGDRYDQPPPRDYERPSGKYVMKSDFILSTFREGENVSAIVQITAPHKGTFTFFLCNVDKLPNPVEATQECLHENLLYNYNTKSYYYAHDMNVARTHEIVLQLPEGLQCHHCVLQWKYRAGNSWDQGCLGCGNQEEFYSCADLRITARDGSLPSTPSPPTTTTHATTPTPSSVDTTTADYMPTNFTDPYPLSEKDKKFFQCNYCYREVFINGNWNYMPPVCEKIGFPRACPR